ncbi:MAG: hypothetical protein M3388_14715 [Acidobacteriota bacterium]|nr:hypothetical protein [Acidobacteriota bacterium]
MNKNLKIIFNELNEKMNRLTYQAMKGHDDMVDRLRQAYKMNQVLIKELESKMFSPKFKKVIL